MNTPSSMVTRSQSRNNMSNNGNMQNDGNVGNQMNNMSTMNGNNQMNNMSTYGPKRLSGSSKNCAEFAKIRSAWRRHPNSAAA